MGGGGVGDDGGVRCVAVAGRRRRRGQVLPLLGTRRFRHLCRAGRGAGGQAQRPVRAGAMSAATSLARRARWRWPEIVVWVVAFAAILVPTGRHLILNEIAILALFALSLDLILGYAGIISLGQAAFFGLGAYAAGLMCKHVTPDPLAGLMVAIALAALLGLLTSLLVLRGSDLTPLMVTLGLALRLNESANALPQWTGGADGLQGMVVGPLLGRFEFDLSGRTAYAYSLTTLFVLVLVALRIVYSPLGLSLLS